MIVSRSRMMKMVLKSCFSVVSLDFHRFYRHVLAGSTGNGRILFSFGDTYLHLPRDRVTESLWKPHQSKASNFLHRNYVTTFFQLQPKNIFFRDQKYFSKKISQKYFSVKIPKKNWNSKNLSENRNFRFFRDFHRKIFFADFFWKIFLIPKKHIFWLELEKKLVHSFDAENW